MAQHNDLGQWGEQMAAEYLERKGWYIRHRDWQWQHKDLDIVAIDEDMTTLLIVEVKTRATGVFGEPDEAVNLEKRNNLLKATAAYVRECRLEYLNVRYDTISVIGTPESLVSINHKENAINITSAFHFYEEKRRRSKYKKKPGCW